MYACIRLVKLEVDHTVADAWWGRLPALEETRTGLASTQDEAEIASAATFYQRHGVHIHEFMRGAPASVVQKILLRTIDLMRSEVIRIPIGPDPLDEK
jgi:hypothetical protein